MKKTDEQFKQEALLANHKVSVIGKYNRRDEKILVRCNECGREYYTYPFNVLKGTGCRKCADKANSVRSKLPLDEFNRRLADTNPNFKLIGEYVNNSTNVTILCSNCNQTFQIRPSNLFTRSTRCPHCTIHPLAKTQEEFERDVALKNPDITILSKYKNNQTYIQYHCNVCNSFFTSKATWLLQGKGCPECNSSKGERAIKSFLQDNSIRFIKEYKLEDCKDINALPFDFYLPDINTIIEFDGLHHYEVVYYGDITQEEAIDKFILTQFHDNIKNHYCEAKGIRLIRIPYWDLKNIRIILQNCLTIN